MQPLNGSEILCHALMEEGVEILFGYPGGAILPFYDALYRAPSIQHVLMRHEQAAAHAADGFARATGKVGVVVGLDGDVTDETLSDLCMHIAFADPMGISPDDIPADLVEKEKEIAKQQAIDSGKPPEIAEKMVIGKINKFLAERALLEQQFVKDDKRKVKEILGGATITSFARFAVGGSE